jgi:hypothetical protein
MCSPKELCKKVSFIHREWWYLPVISVVGKLMQEDHKFEVNLDYIVRFCLKKKKDVHENIININLKETFQIIEMYINSEIDRSRCIPCNRGHHVE